MKETWFGEDYVMVTIHWGVTFETLDKPVEFDVSYLVQLTDETPKDHPVHRPRGRGRDDAGAVRLTKAAQG